jgi:2-polyprenyl-3-methyl-5-hydroxy-6-metoxy-1,4-benzoquinol methylase
VGTVIKAPEAVCGTGEVFDYLECSACGVVWLTNPPDDMKKYYENYYSMSMISGTNKSNFLHRIVQKLTVGGIGCLTRSSINRRHAAINRTFGKWWIARAIRDNRGVENYISPHLCGFSLNACALLGLGLSKDASILDYGSGDGEFVEEMFRLGFKNTVGMDPFIEKDLMLPSGGMVFSGDMKGNTHRIGLFDLITLNHSFEHIPNPAEIATLLLRHLKDDGVIVLRFPNVGSVHFKQYRENWWGLHAPRHYFLHTKKSLEEIFVPLGAEIRYVKCDSCYDHYLYSQEYELGIYDQSPYSFRRGNNGIFTNSELRYWKKKTRLLNRALVGDWIVYYIAKKHSD